VWRGIGFSLTHEPKTFHACRDRLYGHPSLCPIEGLLTGSLEHRVAQEFPSKRPAQASPHSQRNVGCVGVSVGKVGFFLSSPPHRTFQSLGSSSWYARAHSIYRHMDVNFSIECKLATTRSGRTNTISMRIVVIPRATYGRGNMPVVGFCLELGGILGIRLFAIDFLFFSSLCWVSVCE